MMKRETCDSQKWTSIMCLSGKQDTQTDKDSGTVRMSEKTEPKGETNCQDEWTQSTT